MSNGKVIQIIGAVIDVEFEKDNIPNVYEALTIDGLEIILEVQQQLGDGIVRTIAMGTTEGLKRGLQAERTNAPISVPVGTETLGRIMDVLGNPIDEKGPIGEQERMPIHRKLSVNWHSFLLTNWALFINWVTQNIHDASKCFCAHRN